MRFGTSLVHRRSILRSALCGALLSVALLPMGRAQSAEQVEVAALFTSAVSQGNWDPGGYAAFKAMTEKYGYKPSFIENATYEKAPALLRQLASRGVKMIICHSSGYSAAIKEVAADFPDTEFVLYSYADSTADLKNYTAWSVNWDEYGYVVGALAAAASTSKHIGIVAGEEIPSANRAIDFMSRGAKAVTPDITIDTLFIGSFTDVAKAKEVSTGLIARGADVLLPSADTADAGTMQAADEEEVHTVGSYMDQSAAYPNAVITSTKLNFDKSYDEMGAMLKDGTLGNKIIPVNLANGGWGLVEPFQHVDAAVQTSVLALVDKVAKKEIDVGN